MRHVFPLAAAFMLGAALASFLGQPSLADSSSARREVGRYQMGILDGPSPSFYVVDTVTGRIYRKEATDGPFPGP